MIDSSKLAILASQKAELLRREAELWEDVETFLKDFQASNQSDGNNPSTNGRESSYQSHEMLTSKQAAEYLNIKTTTLPVWRIRGDGPRYTKIGRMVRYRVSDLDEYIASRSKQNTAQ